MGANKTPKFGAVIDRLVQLLEDRQQQLECLLEERKVLEDRIRTQHERWVSDVRLCQDHISQMKDSLKEKEMEILLVQAKSDLMVALKHREASLVKLNLEQTEDELVDFRAGFDHLSRMQEKNGIETDKENEQGRRSKSKSSASRKLDDEIKRLKIKYEKLSSEKSSEISALLKEKSFIWNQYNILESDLTSKLKSKEAEIDQANNKITKLVASVEQLRSSNNQKGEKIKNLRSKMAEVEIDRDKLKEEVSKLTQELKTVEESTSVEATPVLRTHGERLTSRAKTSLSNGSNVIVKKEFPSEKGSRNLKRKKVEEVRVLETPKLFSSSFKVPKLKTPSVSGSPAAARCLQPINRRT